MSETVVTHVTEGQYASRHFYCITMQMVGMVLRDTLRKQPDFEIKEKHRHGHCDHPEDGLCLGPFGSEVTTEQLADVNERLAARVGKKPSAAPKQPRAAVSDSKQPTEEPGKPKRGLPSGLREYLEKKRKQKERSA